MGKGSRGKVAWKRERQRKVKEIRKRKLRDHVQKWKEINEERGEANQRALRQLKEIMDKRRKYTDQLNEKEGPDRFMCEMAYLGTEEGEKAMKLLESLSDAEATQEALKIAGEVGFMGGETYLVNEKGAKLEVATSLEEAVEPTKAEPDRTEKKAETRTDNAILWELHRELKEWNCYGWERHERKERKIVELVGELSDVNSTLDGRTALMMCARIGRPRAIHKLRELGADPTIKDNNGNTARDHAAWADHWSIEDTLKEMEREWLAAEKGKEDTNDSWRYKTDKEKLIGLSKTVEEWRKAAGRDRGELRDNAMIILKTLGHVNSAYHKKTALMRCAEKGFLPGVKYLIEGRNADSSIKGQVGTALDYALVVRERGYKYVDSVIGYLERLDRETEARNGTRG